MNRAASGGSTNGYDKVNETRATIITTVPGIPLPVIVTYVAIECKDPGFEPCPPALIAQNNDLTAFEEYCYNHMYQHGLDQLTGGSLGGTYSTTITNGVDTALYRVEWNKDSQGNETVDVYIWLAAE